MLFARVRSIERTGRDQDAARQEEKQEGVRGPTLTKHDTSEDSQGEVAFL